MILLFGLMKLLWGVTNLQPQGIGTCTLARRKEHRKCRGSCLFAAPWVYPPQAATRTLAFRASCKLNSRRSLHLFYTPCLPGFADFSLTLKSAWLVPSYPALLGSSALPKLPAVLEYCRHLITQKFSSSENHIFHTRQLDRLFTRKNDVPFQQHYWTRFSYLAYFVLVTRERT